MGELKPINIYRLFIRAFVWRDMDAMHDIGARYGGGWVSHVDKETGLRRAAYFYRLAAKRGHVESQYDLGFMMCMGEVSSAGKEEGLALLKRASQAGYEPALKLYADLCEDI